MDLIETVGARMVLLGQREYVSGLSEARRLHADLTATVRESVAPSQALTDATIEAQAATTRHAEAMKVAVSAQHDYERAASELVAANERVAASDTVATRSARDEAQARLSAAESARLAASREAAAAGESAAAATTAAAEVETAERRKAAAAEMGSTALKTAAFGVTAVAAVVTGVSVKMAADFEQSTMRLVTSAGESRDNLELVRQGILGMAGDVGYSSEELSAAMYKVESGGHHAGDGLQVLRAAAQGAKTENADLATVADAVTSALQDYHLKGSDAANVTSRLVAATANGKTTFEELARSMSAILPIASANHVSLEDILGDLSSMTIHGMSAQQASQNLADAIRHMAAPTQVQQKELALLGMNAQDLSAKLGSKGLSGTIMEISSAIQAHMGPGASKVILDMQTALKGLPPTVQELGKQLMTGSITMKDYGKAAKELDPIAGGQAMQFASLAKTTHGIGNTQKDGATVMQSYSKALRDAMGDATGLNVALMLTGENTGTTTGAINAIKGATTDADGAVRGWSEIQGTFNTKLAQAKDGLGALAIQIGTVLLPPLTVLLGWVAAGATWFSAHRDAAVALAIVMGVVLVGGLAAASVALWSMVAPLFAVSIGIGSMTLPILLVIGAVLLAAGIIGFAVYEIIDHWSGIAGFFADIWSAIETGFAAVGSFFVGVGHFFETAWNMIAAGATWLWETILSPIFSAIWWGLRFLATVVITIFVLPFVFAFKILAAIFTWWWDTIAHPIFQAVGAAAMWLYQNAIRPAFAAIQVFMIAAWLAIREYVINPFKIAIAAVGALFMMLWTAYVVPAWNGVKAAGLAAYSWMVAYIFHPIGVALSAVGGFFSMLWHTYVTPAWNGIMGALGAGWRWLQDNVFHPIGVALTVLGEAFGAAVVVIGAAWRRVQDAVSVPIHWVVDHVYTGGIKAVWDSVADFTGMGHLPAAPAFATGGVLGGYAPGQDSVMAWLSPGEGVLVPEAVRMLGPDWVHSINAAASGRASGLTAAHPAYAAGGTVPAFADGGILGSIGDAVGGAAQSVVGWAGKVIGDVSDFFTDPVAKAKAWLNGIITGAAGDKAAVTPLAQEALHVPGKAIDALVKKVTDWWATQNSYGGAMGAAPPGQINAWIQQALAILRWPAGYAAGIYHQIMTESGGNPGVTQHGYVDVNTLSGNLAQGIMQVIPPTFRANALPGHGNPFNPVDNIIAGSRYAMGRYGAGWFADGPWHSHGYAGGGVVPAGPIPAGLAPAYSGGGIVVLDGARAAGGPVSAGGAYLVGERGPEVFVPSGHGSIVPTTSGAAARGGDGVAAPLPTAGAATVYATVTINEAHDPQACYEATKRGIADAMARR